MCRRAGKTAASSPAISSRRPMRPRIPPPQPWMTEPATRGRARGARRRPASRRGSSAAACATRCSARPDRRYRHRDAGAARAGHRGAGAGRHQGGADRHRARHRDGGGRPPRHFEITTLRRDVETYGRRARVAFDADWARGRGAPRLHDQRDLSRSRRQRARPGRRARRPRARAGCGLSATRPPASPRMCCGCCAITGSRRGSAPARRSRGARRLPRRGAAAAEAVGRARRAGADPAAGGRPTRCRRCG